MESAPVAAGGGGGRKDEWATGASTDIGQDQSLLQWIVGDIDDASFGLKQLLQGANHNEIDSNVSLGIVDQSSSCIPIPTGDSTGNAMTSMTSTLSCGGGSGLSSNDHNNGKIASTMPNSSSGIVNCKGPNVGLNSNPQSITTSLLNNFPLLVSVPPGASFQQQFETPDQKHQIFNAQVSMNQQLFQVPHNPQSQSFFPPPLYTQQDHPLQHQTKRQNLGVGTLVILPPLELLFFY
ncbi:hypothetical protein F0562_032907 [Nyssa sinensis]|uniref:Uncharacterized protein n=1 Tax=Nyssa sinensis TaxID=561372 RepID=A0A5J5AT08_9ASTE|nr:hypothetical protein F0562_032907 [Nyssa sinensis]